MTEMSEYNLALELGEFFYQLRAALDGLIYRAVMLKKSSNFTPNENRLQFPITTKPSEFKDKAVEFAPLSDGLKFWLESIQPYNASKVVGTDDESLINLLVLLNDCARKDRHRKLHVVAALPADFEFDFSGFNPACRVVSFEVTQGNALENEAVLFRFALDGHVPGMTHEMKFDLSFEISVEEIVGVQGPETGVVIKSLVNAVSAIIYRFEKDFSSNGSR